MPKIVAWINIDDEIRPCRDLDENGKPDIHVHAHSGKKTTIAPHGLVDSKYIDRHEFD